MRKWLCYDHKTWTSDNWKRSCDMVKWIVLHAVPYMRKSLRLENTLGSLQSENETRGDSMMVWAAISCFLLVPLLPFMAELPQGSTWTGWVIMCIPWSRCYFPPNNDTVFQDDSVPIHTGELVQSWYEQHEGELQHFHWTAQSPDLNITETLWSVLETTMMEQVPTSNISTAIWKCSSRKMLYNSARDCLKLVRIHFRYDYSCIESKRCSHTILIKKCVQYL
jgi:hypothetical protein